MELLPFVASFEGTEKLFPCFTRGIDSDRESQFVSGYVSLISHFSQPHLSTVTLWHDNVNIR